MSEISWTQIARFVSSREGKAPGAIHDEVVSLFGELRGPLLRYLSSLGLSVSDGEDVVQEVFLALFRHLVDGKPRDNLHGWVFRVARNIGLKRLQQQPGSTCALDDVAISDPSANAEERAVHDQQRRAVRAAVAALPELDRQCLYLRAEGLRYRDIAEALEVSLGSVAAALSRALDRLARVARLSHGRTLKKELNRERPAGI